MGCHDTAKIIQNISNSWRMCDVLNVVPNAVAKITLYMYQSLRQRRIDDSTKDCIIKRAPRVYVLAMTSQPMQTSRASHRTAFRGAACPACHQARTQEHPRPARSALKHDNQRRAWEHTVHDVIKLNGLAASKPSAWCCTRVQCYPYCPIRVQF